MTNLRTHTLAAVVALCLAAGCSDATTDRSSSDTVPPATVPATTVPATTVPAETGAPTGTDGCRTEATGPEEFQYTAIEGVDPDLTSLDIYLPAGCDPAPVVMWVHGGGWRRGDKVQTVGYKADMVNDLGAALVSVNYRLSTPDSDVKWPDHGNDLAAAIAWVQAHGAEHGLDPSRLALIGHSAGGHLVSIVVTDPTLLAAAGSSADSISCVAGLDSAAYDLAGSPAEESGLVPNAFGTDPDVVADASPQIQVERNGAPQAAILVVTRGSDGRIAGAQRFVDALNDGGGTATLAVARPYSHDDVARRLGEPDEDIVTPVVREFLQGCLDL